MWTVLAAGWRWILGFFAGSAVTRYIVPVLIAAAVLGSGGLGWYLKTQVCNAVRYKSEIAALERQLAKQRHELAVALKAHEADAELVAKLQAINKRNQDIINALPTEGDGGVCLDAAGVDRLRSISGD